MTAIDEKEIARLRGTRGGWATQDKDALLDEVERLRGLCTRYEADRIPFAEAYAKPIERERDEARAQAAAMQAVIDRDLVVTPHAETCICPRCRLTVESGRDILDALAKAEAVLRDLLARDLLTERWPHRPWDDVGAALTAIQALGISKQRT